jgi:diaminopimelate epimerase
MKFTKMHGCGNDYVYMDCTREMVDDPAALAIRLSNRHFGVGSDGLILICPSEQGDFRMRMFNADGSEGAMCGNGIRCVAKFVYDKGLTNKTRIAVETLGGMKYLDLTVEEGKVSKVRVDMGAPILEAERIPVQGLGDQVVGRSVHVAGQDWDMTCVSMGNPHAVVWCEDVKGLDIEKIGPQFERHPMFPDRVNTEFVRVLDRSNVEMRVWERGSGETLACGTGACAVAVACFLNGRTERKVTVHLLGGDLDIEVTEGSVFMTGPATTVFEGELV